MPLRAENCNLSKGPMTVEELFAQRTSGNGNSRKFAFRTRLRPAPEEAAGEIVGEQAARVVLVDQG